MPRRAVLLIVLLVVCTAASFASDVLDVYQGKDAGGTIFEGPQPRTSPKECWVSVFDTGPWRVVTVSTDQPFRADKKSDFVGSAGSKFTAITFKLPPTIPQGNGGETTSKDPDGYDITYRTPKQPAGGLLVEVKYVGDVADIMKDTAEIVFTSGMEPVSVRIDSLTRSGKINKKSKLKCDGFTKAESREMPADTTAAAATGEGGEAPSPQEAFWKRLHELCGKAYAHTQDPPVPNTPILDLRKCDETSVTFGVHFQMGEGKWNRSQSWVISKAEGGLHMEFTQTSSSAPDAKRTGWTAATKDPGSVELQVFLPEQKTIEATPALAKFGWVIRLQAATAGFPTLLYQAVEQTDAGEQSRGGYIFDLSAAIDPPERPPWGIKLDTPAAPAADAAPAAEPPAAPPEPPPPAPPAEPPPGEGSAPPPPGTLS